LICAGVALLTVNGCGTCGGGHAVGAANLPWPKFKHDNLNTGRVGSGAGAAGTEAWEFTADSGVYSTAAIDSDGTIYIISSNGTVYALNGATGGKKWQATIDGGGPSSPAIAPDGTIYVAGGNSVYGLDRSNGAQKWRFNAGSRSFESSMAVGADSTIYIGDESHTVYGIDGKTGLQKWAFDTVGPHRRPCWPHRRQHGLRRNSRRRY